MANHAGNQNSFPGNQNSFPRSQNGFLPIHKLSNASDARASERGDLGPKVSIHQTVQDDSPDRTHQQIANSQHRKKKSKKHKDKEREKLKEHGSEMLETSPDLKQNLETSPDLKKNLETSPDLKQNPQTSPDLKQNPETSPDLKQNRDKLDGKDRLIFFIRIPPKCTFRRLILCQRRRFPKMY